MKLAIICNYPIPYGMAATTRIFSYAKGLVANKCDVEVISWLPSDTNFSSHLGNSGIFDGVKYSYTYKRYKNKNKAIRIIEGLFSVLCLVIKLYKENKKQKYDAIIVSSDHLYVLFYLSLINFLIKTKLVFIFDEYPIPIRVKLKDKIPNWKFNSYKYILKSYSGYISMTENLLKFYQNINYKKGVVVSSITDISRFNNLPLKKIGKKPNEHFNITYMGNMELSKDNIDNIIKAISLIIQKYNITLYLYGKPSTKDKQTLTKLIKEYDLEKKVIFTFAQYDEIPSILSKADILVSSQPNTTRAAGGFPTKLGEYLATGNPVLLNEVGEISTFFKNGEEVYLVEANNPEKYANALTYIIEHYAEAIKVGEKGKNKIYKYYSHIIAGSEIKNFLINL